jgi:hypothetical protein
MIPLLALLFSTSQPCYASAEVEVRSLIPVMVSIDGGQPRLAGPFLHRAGPLDPGPVTLRVTGLFGKLLVEETWTLDDWITHRTRVRAQTLTLEGRHRSPGAPMTIDDSPAIPSSPTLPEAATAQVRFVRTEGPAIQIWIDDVPSQDLLAGAVSTTIDLPLGSYFIEILDPDAGTTLHRGVLTLDASQGTEFDLGPSPQPAIQEAWKSLPGR